MKLHWAHARFSSVLAESSNCHSYSLGPVSLVIKPDETFTQQKAHFGDFHLLPTSGHTPGSSSFLYHSPLDLRHQPLV